MEIVNHWLVGKGVEHLKTTKIGKGFAPGQPNTLVLHYTALDNCQQAVKLLCSDKNDVSVHLVIGRDGDIKQLAPFDVITWHAGKSEHMKRQQLNQYAIGIEMDNAGRLENKQGKFFSWQGQQYPPEETMLLTHRYEDSPCYWHRYSNSQIRLVRYLCRLLMQQYSIQWLVGHEEISPQRKFDPGPAFPLDVLKKQLAQEKDGFLSF